MVDRTAGDVGPVLAALDAAPRRTPADLLVVVRVPPEVALARLAARASRHSRTQLLDEPERLAELERGARLLDQLVVWWSGRWPDRSVTTLDGAHDDAADHDQLLDRICARRPPGAVSPADPAPTETARAQTVYSMCRTGAFAAPPSNDSATRVPSPVTNRASALPLAQPGRSTISWSTAARLGVRWSAVARRHGRPRHRRSMPRSAVVLDREEMLLAVVVNAPALSAASPATVTLVVAVDTSSTWNWTQAAVIVARPRQGHPGEPHRHGLRGRSVLAQVQVTAGQGDRTGRGAFLGVVGAGPHGDVQHRAGGGAGSDTVTVTSSLTVSAPSSPVSRST